MFCPQCGNKLLMEGAAFCPYCGCSLVSYQPTPPETPAEDAESVPGLDAQAAEQATAYAYVMDHDGLPIREIPAAHRHSLRNKLVAVLVAIFVMSAGVAVVVFDGNSDSQSGSSYTVVSNNSTDTVQLIDSNDQIILFLGNAFYATSDSTAYMTASFTSGHLVMTLDSSITAKCTSYTWKLTENTGTLTFDSVTKTAGYLTWYSPQYGDYTITVVCTQSDGSTVEYIGTLDIQVYYSWTYDDNSYTMTVDLSYADYYASHATTYSAKSARAVTNWSTVTDFVVVDSTVESIASQLKTLYTDTYGSVSLNQSYANFILAFVQIEFTYQYDSTLYGQDEYWAYPIETIFNNGGDCEDTSILCAAIYTAAGFQAAVAILPGHAICGVALSSYSTPTYSSNSYEILKQTVSGNTYYACETTVDTFLAVGVEPISSSYGAFSQYLGQSVRGYGTYGFYPISA